MPAVVEAIAHEIERPDLIHRRNQRQRLAQPRPAASAWFVVEDRVSSRNTAMSFQPQPAICTLGSPTTGSPCSSAHRSPRSPARPIQWTSPRCPAQIRETHGHIPLRELKVGWSRVVKHDPVDTRRRHINSLVREILTAPPRSRLGCCLHVL